MNADFKIKGKKIKTKRLLLRSFQEGDLDDFYEYAKVDGVGEMAGWAHHKNKEETKEILKSFIDGDETFAIVEKETGKLIGSIGVKEYDENEIEELKKLKGRELGFVLSKNYWGKGLMPEALTVLISYLFKDIRLDFLACGYYDFNSQSKKVQEKCGFQPYKAMTFHTRLGTEEKGVLNLLFNPKRKKSI